VKPIIKTKVRKIIDPKEVAATVAKGKYREHLPHFTKDGDGLLVEVKELGSARTSEAHPK
jgi:hypothetical protein